MYNGSTTSSTDKRIAIERKNRLSSSCDVCAKPPNFDEFKEHLKELHRVYDDVKQKEAEKQRMCIVHEARKPDLFLGNARGSVWIMTPEESKWVRTGEGNPPETISKRRHYEDDKLVFGQEST